MINNLPQGWEAVPLKNLVEPRADRVSPKLIPDAPFIGMEHVEPHTNKILKTVPAHTMASNAARFYEGDVLYGRMRPYLNKVVAPPFSGLASAEFIVLPGNEAIDSRFLLRRLSSSDFMGFACSQYEGDRPRVKYDQLGNFTVLLPPVAEQARIVEKLDELLSDLDAGVYELKVAQRKLTQYRQSLLKAAAEGTLTADWRASQDQPQESGTKLLQRMLNERFDRWQTKQLAKFEEQGKDPPTDWKKKYAEPMRAEVNESARSRLPESWAWASVDQAGDVQLGRQRAPQFHSGENMVPYLRVANVFEDRIDISDVMEMHFSAEDEETFKLRYNDILLNEGQSLELVGRPALYRNELPRACFTNTLVRFRADYSVVPEFALAVFRHYMHAGRFTKIAKITTNIAHLGAGRFSALEFPLPPATEQSEIVRILAKAFEQVSLQEMAIEHGLKQAAAQRQNILRAAFEGKLVSQDANDEPVGAVLKRIRLERPQKEKASQTRKDKQTQEISVMVRQLIDVLTEAGDWVPAQEAFRRCGVADGTTTERIEELYAELRRLDKAGRLDVEPVADAQGRKLYDKLKLVAG